MLSTVFNETSLTRGASRNIRKTILPNGLTVLTESVEHLRSVSMGVWITSGSRDEAAEINGISHFIEHMVFKGTTSRPAQQIAREVDSIGGNLDAFTSKEMVCFNIKVLDDNVAPGLDILADLVLHPTFACEEILREQGVILEEIKMDADNPDYLVSEIFTQNFWKGVPLGRPTLGTRKTVSGFNQQVLFDFYGSRFTPANIIFSAAGHLDHESFVAQVEQHFRSLAPANGHGFARIEAPPATPHITLRRKKALEQVQLCLGMPAPAAHDPDRYAMSLLSCMLGGGMSSRLFQTIREDQGLAYSIFSEVTPFRDTGSLCIFAGIAVENTRRVLELTLGELRRLKEEAVGETELKRAKDLMKSNMILALEGSSSRMANLARQQIYFGRFFAVDEIIREIEAVTPESIQTLAARLFRPEALSLTLLGNLGEMRVERGDLVC
ncbi:MAG: insulinase family protein [Acidobacteriaceae bacterium]|nr:insulinase family protein [Acidobacteriaceae bacterium]